MEDFLTYDENDTIRDDVKIVEQILRNAGKYLPDSELRKIQKAYIFAAEAHFWQKRLSGENYIVHPLRATQILMTLKPDATTIQTCILHDVLEDTDVSYEELKSEFGEEVANLCAWLVKVSKVRYHGEERQIETLKKTFLAMASDLRVIFVKIADRIHNIQTLHFHPKEEKKQRIALETLKIYVPICKRLGLYQFQLYLENGVFKILYPKEYQQVIEFLKTSYPKASKSILNGIDSLKRLLDQQWVHYQSVKGRVKSPYRIYEKLMIKYQTLDFSQVFDVIAFRVVVDTIWDCYNVLWIVHSAYNPLINKIKDYIAVPKSNGYQSLHTTVLGFYPFPVEIQIRTKEMDTIAEFWVAAHYIYKETSGSEDYNVFTQRQRQWMQDLQKSVQQYQLDDKKEDFKNRLAVELLDNSIFVYTPKWDVIELSKWSTVLDFAFKIHTDIWLKFRHALVNNSIKPIGYVLSSWDIVSIETYKNKYTATKYRGDYLHTPSAKSKLLRFIKQQEKDNYIQKGIDLVNKKLEENDLPLISNIKDKIKKFYGSEFEHRMIQVANRAKSAFSLVKEVYQISNELPSPKKTTPEELVRDPDSDIPILIDDSPLFEYTLCKQCKPRPYNRIIAKSSRNAFKIHNLDCKSLKHISLDKLYKAQWKWKEQDPYHFSIWLTFSEEHIKPIALLSLMDKLGIQVNEIQFKRPKTLQVEFDHHNPSKIAYVINYIQKNYKQTIHITREIS